MIGMDFVMQAGAAKEIQHLWVPEEGDLYYRPGFRYVLGLCPDEVRGGEGVVWLPSQEFLQELAKERLRKDGLGVHESFTKFISHFLGEAPEDMRYRFYEETSFWLLYVMDEVFNKCPDVSKKGRFRWIEKEE